tara:strand:+ start:237 stop:617 length:381 start_codon:yes stop_codon:yes gene_type:complete
MISKPRPKYLNLFAIRLPIPGIVSILHRISGFLMVALLGALIFVLDHLITSPESYSRISFFFENLYVKLLLIVPIWALSHHLLAGIRFLLLDFHFFIDLKSTRIFSALIMFISVLVTSVVWFRLVW